MHSAENTGDVRCLTDSLCPSSCVLAFQSVLALSLLPPARGSSAWRLSVNRRDPFRLSGLALIIAGMVGLKLASGH